VKQPAKGLLATALVIAVSLFLVSRFDYPTFSGWVSYCLMSLIPMEIVIGVAWQTKFPVFAGSRSQPLKGLLLIVFNALAAGAAGLVMWWVAGASKSPPPPMLIMCTIVCVVVMFNLAIMWGGWPFNKAISSPLGAGIAMWVACYVINYGLFRLFFDYGFMQGAPVYVASLDPHGMFNAWNAVVFYVTAIGGMFLVLHFDLWPLTAWPPLMKQPALGVVWTILILALGAAAFYIGLALLGMDVVDFMVRVPVPFIFGTILVLNMLQGWLFAGLKQPIKGLASAAAAALAGTLLAMAYRSLMPSITAQLNPGPPGYEAEIWLASALLGVTFPFLIFYAEFFQFWPLQGQAEAKSR
jgi:hypothetical protein